ncbi:MAG: DinB family protein [Flavitalea sp.]
MKEILEQLAAYNVWATTRLVDVIKSLPGEDQTRELTASFPSLYLTLLHMWDAESIWWQRMKLSEHVVAPSVNFKGSTMDVSAALIHQGELWKSWIGNSRNASFEHEFIYYNLRKERFKQPIYEMLIHLFNHGTYHRGQLVCMLRELGIKEIPATDLIVFQRKKK